MATPPNDPGTTPAADARKQAQNRDHQTFPVLDAVDMARIVRFGTHERYAKGEALIRAGQPTRGMFLVTAGRGEVLQRFSPRLVVFSRAARGGADTGGG